MEKKTGKEKYKFKLSLDVRDIQGLLIFIEEDSEYLNNQGSLKSSVTKILNKIANKITSEATEKDETALHTRERIYDILNNRRRCPSCGEYKDELFQLNKEEQPFRSIGCDECTVKRIFSWSNESLKTIHRVHSNHSQSTCRIIVLKKYKENKEIWDLIKKHGIKKVEGLISNLDFASMNHGTAISHLVYQSTKKAYFEYNRNTIEESLLDCNVMKFFLKFEDDVHKQDWCSSRNMTDIYKDYREICKTLLNNEEKELQIPT